jgi:hypothetical protein
MLDLLIILVLSRRKLQLSLSRLNRFLVVVSQKYHIRSPSHPVTSILAAFLGLSNALFNLVEHSFDHIAIAGCWLGRQILLKVKP